MIVVAVTGGVACGKSTACETLVRNLPGLRHFSCDLAVGELLGSPGIQEKIRFMKDGEQCFPNGKLDKKILRKVVFENSAFRETLELTLHPRVLDEAVRFLGNLPVDVKMALLEVPLLYESNFLVDRDLDLVVGASREVQMRRLCESRKLDERLAGKIIKSQMPVAGKVSRADVVVWNDGSRSTFDTQVCHLADRCRTLFK